jgi:hypothetical protein
MANRKRALSREKAREGEGAGPFIERIPQEAPIQMDAEPVKFFSTGTVVDDPAVVRDRYRFLQCLQNVRPDFWRSLRGSCLFGDRLTADEWAVCAEIKDEWLIQVARDTIARWQERPDDGGSKLEEGYEWFDYTERAPIPPFSPIFANAWPLFNGLAAPVMTDKSGKERRAIAKSQRIETPNEFATRMTKQFRRQLTEYKRKIRHVSPQGDNRAERGTHAIWTALVYSGRNTFEEITSAPSLQNNQDSYATVQKAVKRFAKHIKLTLPPQRTRT